MRKVVSFSLGRTSAKLSIWAKNRFEDCDVVCMDTTAEHPKSYEFGKNVNSYFNLDTVFLQTVFSDEIGVGNSYRVVDINSLKTDLSVYKGMVTKYGVPYIGGMFCNDRMKMVPYKKYCQEKYGRGNYETILGIRIDEPARYLGQAFYSELKKIGYDDYEDLIKIYETMKHDGVRGLHGWLLYPHGKSKTWKAYRAASKRIKNLDFKVLYMAEFLDDEKEDINSWWDEQPFNLDIPEWLGNCVFCPKKSNLKLAAAQRDEPGLYLDFLDMIHSPSVRFDNKTGHWSKMYRGKKSLENVIAMFDGSSGNEIKSRIRGGHHVDTGSCSESCEIFNGEEQLLFEF